MILKKITFGDPKLKNYDIIFAKFHLNYKPTKHTTSPSNLPSKTVRFIEPIIIYDVEKTSEDKSFSKIKIINTGFLNIFQKPYHQFEITTMYHFSNEFKNFLPLSIIINFSFTLDDQILRPSTASELFTILDHLS